MKKVVALLVVGSLFIAQTAYASEVTIAVEKTIHTNELNMTEAEGVSVDPELIGFVDVFQEVAVELSETEKDKLKLLVNFIAQTNKRLETLLTEEKFDDASIMLENYNADIDKVQELLARSSIAEVEEELEVVEEIEEIFVEKTSMRSVNLQELLNREDLPAPALAGIEKALKNQKRAEEKHQLAQERKAQRKALKAEQKTVKQENEEDEVVKTGEEEELASSTPVQKQNGKPEKAQKAQDKATKQAEKGKERAEKAQQKASERGQGNNGKN
ncbi:hypothetical protein [Alkalihalobacillus deserti]|uniref:hypothetical protein n=1 Tax=Alkalihalobacillus deserti TaxID=2879466 RepID=UPI001D15DAEC|nr:hypothetical protein [Alkalihalobacillus deserti]